MGKVMWLHKENFKTTTKEGLSVIITEPASRHMTKVNMAFLCELFSGKVISRYGDVEWPLGFPFFISFPFLFLLPPLDYLKSSMYWNNLQTLVELKKGITDEIRNCSA